MCEKLSWDHPFLKQSRLNGAQSRIPRTVVVGQTSIRKCIHIIHDPIQSMNYLQLPKTPIWILCALTRTLSTSHLPLRMLRSPSYFRESQDLQWERPTCALLHSASLRVWTSEQGAKARDMNKAVYKAAQSVRCLKPNERENCLSLGKNEASTRRKASTSKQF